MLTFFCEILFKFKNEFSGLATYYGDKPFWIRHGMTHIANHYLPLIQQIADLLTKIGIVELWNERRQKQGIELEKNLIFFAKLNIETKLVL